MAAKVKDPQGILSEETKAAIAGEQPDKPQLQVGSQVWFYTYAHPPGIASLGDPKIVPYSATVTGIHDHTDGIVNLAILDDYYQTQLWRVKVRYAPGKHECWGWPAGVIPDDHPQP